MNGLHQAAYRPGSGSLCCIISWSGSDKALVQKWVLGFDELKIIFSRKLHPNGQKVTGIPAKLGRSQKIMPERNAAIFCNAGISHQLNAFDTYRTLAFLAAVTGNISERWRMQFHAQHLAWVLNLPALKSNLPKKDIALPVGPDYFAQSILTGSPHD